SAPSRRCRQRVARTPATAGSARRRATAQTPAGGGRGTRRPAAPALPVPAADAHRKPHRNVVEDRGHACFKAHPYPKQVLSEKQDPAKHEGKRTRERVAAKKEGPAPPCPRLNTYLPIPY